MVSVLNAFKTDCACVGVLHNHVYLVSEACIKADV